MNDTIYATATAPGRAAVAIIRLSGPAVGDVLATMGAALLAPRKATLRRLIDPVSRETLDEALVIFMPGPASFTGEDVAELHLHGGRAVVSSVMAALAALDLRLAEPGEFTRRAFENGRLDLTEAEAVADLVDAESMAQRRQALAQLGGAASRAVEGWRADLLKALAGLEAAIDFPDEDIPEFVAEQAAAPLRRLLAELSAAAVDVRGERVREGYRVALVGAPNAGKSSLFNALIGRSAAIVTEVAGTTRDVIEQSIEVAGYKVLLADTAGLRDTDDRIEAEGVRRAMAWAEAADLRLWIVDRSASSGECRSSLAAVRQGDLLVFNKSDLPLASDALVAREAGETLELEPVEASVIAEDGMAGLAQALERRVVRDLTGGEPPAVTRIRHRRQLGEAVLHLQRALDRQGAGAELMAEDVRLAARALDALVGVVDAEAVLGEVFSTFCVGK